jgi:hypothetical protein
MVYVNVRYVGPFKRLGVEEGGEVQVPPSKQQVPSTLRRAAMPNTMTYSWLITRRDRSRNAFEIIPGCAIPTRL